MDLRDKKYINHVAENVDGYIYEYLILPDETRIYVNPEAFEAYIRTFPADLWAPEFRNAYDTITMYRGPQNDEETEKYLNDALAALRLLANTYCPQILEELEAQQPVTNIPKPVTNRVTNEVTKCTNAPRPELPAGIKDTPGARAAFDSLVTAGYLDSEYKPTTSAAKNVICAYMAGTLNQLLGVDHWAKVFADFWGVPNLSQSFFQLNKNGKEYTADIDKALAAAARSCDQLAQTKRGKELLGKK
jgi:hypothetical protein